MTVIRGTARSAPGCHNVCGILSYVKDGKLVKVEGDPEDPYNQGRLCSRCLCIPDYVYHKDRLLHPMKRAKEDRGKDKFVEISWDEAYDIIVEEFKKVADTYGPDKIAMCQGTGRDIHQVTRLNACMGLPERGRPLLRRQLLLPAPHRVHGVHARRLVRYGLLAVLAQALRRPPLHGARVLHRVGPSALLLQR